MFKMKGNTIMKALRYLLMAIAILGVLSAKAQTHQYGATHYSSHEQATYTGVQVNPQMPTATMGYTHSDYMTTGSTLPQAAVEGTTTTYDESNGGSNSNKGAIRKGRPGDWTNPYDDPIGDAAIPLALLALAYLIMRVMRSRKRRV